jgi:hypothetical protein
MATLMAWGLLQARALCLMLPPSAHTPTPRVCTT